MEPYIESQSMQLENHKTVNIRAALTDIDRSRNWALVKAEELVKASALSSDKTVSVKRCDKRGVYVNDVLVFSQEMRFGRGVTFHGAYAGLKLP